MKVSSRDIIIGIKEYLLMTFGMFCYAFGWLQCVLPAGGMGGGAAGLATLINAIIPANIAEFLTIGLPVPKPRQSVQRTKVHTAFPSPWLVRMARALC